MLNEVKRIQIIDTALRSQSVERKATLTKSFSEFAIERFRDGKLKPVIDSIWDWGDANKAHAPMTENKNVGKIILMIRE
ncbi:zinc-binding dehydrogenase [Siminovitchia terrae]|uniref:zinc-binding dehydrogenase n=1 Tax=Siminovitchia terrae TaxID=1914933 RepID=UPI001BB39D9B